MALLKWTRAPFCKRKHAFLFCQELSLHFQTVSEVMKVAVALAWHLKLQGFSLKGRCDTVDLWKPITLWLLLLSSTSLSPNGRFRVLQTTKNHWWWTIKGDYQHIFWVVILLTILQLKRKPTETKLHCRTVLRTSPYRFGAASKYQESFSKCAAALLPLLTSGLCLRSQSQT